MKSKKAIIAMWVIALLPLLLVAATMPRLPEMVPINWSINDVPTYAGKGTLWLLAGISPLLALLLQFLPRIDPRRKNYEKFQGWYDLLGVCIPLVLLVTMGITICESLWPGRVPVGKVICLLVGGLFLVVGNVMGKVKSNYFVGFRTPWALSDPDVWNKTQRMGGRVLFLSGVVMILSAIFAPTGLVLAAPLVVLAAGVVGTCYMSWKWFQEKQ